MAPEPMLMGSPPPGEWARRFEFGLYLAIVTAVICARARVLDNVGAWWPGARERTLAVLSRG